MGDKFMKLLKLKVFVENGSQCTVNGCNFPFV